MQSIFPYLSDIIWALIALIVGIIIGLAVQNKPRDAWRTIAVSLFTVLLVLTLKSSFFLRSEIKDFASDNLHSNCIPSPRASDNPLFDKISLFFFQSVKESSRQIPNGYIDLTPEQVKSVWTLLIDNASFSFWATNIVAPKEWPALSCQHQRGSKVNEIKRVMILKKDDPLFNKELDELAAKQLKDCNVNEAYHYYKDDLWENFRGTITELGTIDIVLADESILLLTTYDEQERMIAKGTLTIDKRKVAEARTLFKMLFKEAPKYSR